MNKQFNPKTKSAFEDAGRSINAWRRLYELKSIQLAERAGISLGTLRKIEKGDTSVGVGAFIEVIRSLGLLEAFTESLDPMNSDLGRARITENMPKRIRR